MITGTVSSGVRSARAHVRITLGSYSTADGTAVDLIAGERVVLESGVTIGGSLSAGTDPAACSQ